MDNQPPESSSLPSANPTWKAARSSGSSSARPSGHAWPTSPSPGRRRRTCWPSRAPSRRRGSSGSRRRRGHACGHFDGRDCPRLATRVVQLLPPVVDGVPPCHLRPDCRWWQQEGKAACLLPAGGHAPDRPIRTPVASRAHRHAISFPGTVNHPGPPRGDGTSGWRRMPPVTGGPIGPQPLRIPMPPSRAIGRACRMRLTGRAPSAPDPAPHSPASTSAGAGRLLGPRPGRRVPIRRGGRSDPRPWSSRRTEAHGAATLCVRPPERPERLRGRRPGDHRAAPPHPHRPAADARAGRHRPRSAPTSWAWCRPPRSSASRPRASRAPTKPCPGAPARHRPRPDRARAWATSSSSTASGRHGGRRRRPGPRGPDAVPRRVLPALDRLPAAWWCPSSGRAPAAGRRAGRPVAPVPGPAGRPHPVLAEAFLCAC